MFFTKIAYFYFKEDLILQPLTIFKITLIYIGNIQPIRANASFLKIKNKSLLKALMEEKSITLVKNKIPGKFL